MRPVLGFLAVALLKILGRLPLWILLAVGNLLLPLYIPFRRRTRAQFGRIAMRPYRVRPYGYYQMRLRLALLSLKHLLGRPDGCEIHVEGREHFLTALRSGKPVVVLGWHQGPVELLHQVPQGDARVTEPVEVARDTTRPFFLLTAKAFAPALTKLMKQGRGASTLRQAQGKLSSATPKEIIHPHSLTALKRWERDKGILALMVDQVPGKPEEWLAPLGGAVQIPYPGKLLDWVSQRDAEFLIVSVRLENSNRIIFRYTPADARLLREDLAFHLDRALRANPEQYNWSYPKIRVH